MSRGRIACAIGPVTLTVADGRTAAVTGRIKTFPLRGMKDSPPYLHQIRAHAQSPGLR
jgi:hypothetical protein